jgi:hypothetical protein
VPRLPAPVSPSRALAGFAVVGAATWMLASVAGLGPSLEVVLAAAMGSAATVRFAHVARPVAVVTLLVVAVIGLGWPELINKAAVRDARAERGSPAGPLMRRHLSAERCRRRRPSAGGGARYSQIFQTPSGDNVLGVA